MKKNILYLNNLYLLPNLGCRSTGNSLKNKLELFFNVIEYEGLYSVLNSPGWDRFAISAIKFGGIIPRFLWNFIWKYRYEYENFYHNLRKIDVLFGAKHDFIELNDPEKSLENFYKIKNKYKELNDLYELIKSVDFICINGEGTFLISNNINRDPSYYFFIILLCKKMNKKVYLLNCMIDNYSLEKTSKESIAFFINYFQLLDGIVVRDYKSRSFLQDYNFNNVFFCLDALFHWGNLFNDFELDEIKKNPIGEKYFLLSGTSASKFYEGLIEERYNFLIESLKIFGIKIVILESCIGDNFLRKIANKNDIIYVSIENELSLLYRYIVNSYIFISGRYHPTVVALSCGIPCISLKCNSNKMEFLQKTILDDRFNIFSPVPNDEEVECILEEISFILENYEYYSDYILNNIRDKCLECDDIFKLIQGEE